MNAALKKQIERLQDILAGQKRSFDRCKPARERIFTEIETRTNVILDNDVRQFFEFSNGSHRETWAAVESDQLVPLQFLTLAQALKDWALFSPYDASVYKEWNVKSNIRDARIQRSYIRHKLWFPLAEFNGGTTQLLYDADPTKQGRFGQIIVYQHDPDAIYYAAGSFVEFLEKSNDLLSQNADELLPVPSSSDDPIWKVCELGDLPRLKKLLAQGTPLDIQKTVFGESHSLLEHAATYGQLPVLQYLLGKGLPFGRALYRAAESGCLDIVKYCLARGEQPDQTKSTLGETALMRAARFGHAATVVLLLKNGARATMRNAEGLNAAELARKGRHADVMALLKP